MAKTETTLAVLFSFVLGGIVGAGTALLLAPRPGKKTRKMIKDFAEDAKDKAAEYTEKIKDVV